jgi:hypothetical protein
MPSMSEALAVVCLAAGLLHVLRLVVLRRDVVGEISHAAMGLGMAAMFSPFGNPLPAAAWSAVFGVCAGWFAVRVLRGAGVGGEAAHHVVCGGAMLFMLAAGHPADAPGGHAFHGSLGAVGGAVALVSVTAILLAGYFAWHALHCVDRTRPAPCPAHEAAAAPGAAVALRAPALSLCAPRTASVAHLVVAVAMTAMLLGML